MLRLLRVILEFPYIRWRVAVTFGCLLLASIQDLTTVHAADRLDKLEREASFHIEPGSLESALLQFSRQAGIQVVLGAKVADFSVAAIDGRRNAREVLTAILSETGLKFSVVGKTVTVHAADTKSHAAAATPLGVRSTPEDASKIAPKTGDRPRADNQP